MTLYANIFTAVTLVTAAYSAAVTPREGKFCSSHAVVPDPTDCSQYFRCLDNKYYVMECGGSLLFSKDESYCDYREHVQCETSKYGIIQKKTVLVIKFMSLYFRSRCQDCEEICKETVE